MTRILELSAELESRLQVLAERRGTTIETLVVQELEKVTLQATESEVTAPQKPLTARQQAVMDGFGKYAAYGLGSENLIRERREEARREIQQAEERDRQHAERLKAEREKQRAA